MLAGLNAASMDPSERSTELSMEELAALADTAGADTVAMVLQTRQAPDPRCFLGAGKLQEIKEISRPGPPRPGCLTARQGMWYATINLCNLWYLE